MKTNVKTAAFAAGLALIGGAAAADSLSPENLRVTLSYGESVTVNRTVTVDAGSLTTGKVDVFFLADTTGSMGSYINTVRTYADNIFAGTQNFGDVAWGVGEYKDFPQGSWGDPTDFPWRLNQAVTQDTDALRTGLGQWSPSGGHDWPESNLYALQQVATDPAVGWRDGASRFAVWFGDAPGHDPVSTDGYPGPNLATTISDLNDADITVFAVGSYDLNINNQATDITGATGGAAFLSGDPGGSITDLIRGALDDAFASYRSVSVLPSGDLDGLDVVVSAAHTGSFDRSTTRSFDFQITYTAQRAGNWDVMLTTFVDRNSVAQGLDSITASGALSPAPVPLPAAGWLLVAGLGGMAALRRRR
ncbi:VPLPA-CTERM sorting domain-containing protein [Paracoccus sp. (in: a-proteobacteria)]|uniref:VPLPA-CTERM sorting domain-containing protein n=1 Tax=Paracoccus sp. TaxID=267 RepID=UPI0026E0FB24|nr:VPLPA-CTERM sorting domain-containing protein [Paracoccus sp. (in: a-proteobacteria)]MDO5648416.1 VPLPA-CTERM sorting domain-containing protein [Paracoccus sp. (in: a-proteobacteria)]